MKGKSTLLALFIGMIGIVSVGFAEDCSPPKIEQKKACIEFSSQPQVLSFEVITFEAVPMIALDHEAVPAFTPSYAEKVREISAVATNEKSLDRYLKRRPCPEIVPKLPITNAKERIPISTSCRNKYNELRC